MSITTIKSLTTLLLPQELTGIEPRHCVLVWQRLAPNRHPLTHHVHSGTALPTATAALVPQLCCLAAKGKSGDGERGQWRVHVGGVHCLCMCVGGLHKHRATFQVPLQVREDLKLGVLSGKWPNQAVCWKYGRAFCNSMHLQGWLGCLVAVWYLPDFPGPLNWMLSPACHVSMLRLVYSLGGCLYTTEFSQGCLV